MDKTTKTSPIEIKTEKLNKLLKAIRMTWQAIGSDIASGCQESGERLTDFVALECTLDANHMSAYGGQYGKEMDKFVGELCERHGVKQVYRYLGSKVKLA